jgi:ribosomal-protein-alanine N-acetyltransferase
MKHKGTIPLETERLILRKHRIEDAEDMFRNWENSEAVTKYLTWTPHRTVDDTRAYIQSILDSYDEKRYEWLITDKATGEPLGAIGVATIWEDIDACEIGYCLGERFWGKGIMSEAFSAVIDYLFSEVGFNRIQSRHDPRNIGSGRVMEKCGLIYEGTLRQADRNNQGICDAVVRAILREGWEQQSAE